MTSSDFQPPAAAPAAAVTKRILVTGGAGFIGSHVVARLVKNYPQYHVVNYDILDYCSCLENVESLVGNEPNYKFVKGSILATDLLAFVLESEKIDTIMHFAAQSHVDNSFGNSFEFTKHNVLGTQKLLEAAKIHGVKLFLHVSTDEVYGEGVPHGPNMKEDHVLEPTNPYAGSKAGAEFLVKTYQRSFNLPTIITRSNNVFGPHQYPEKLIPKFINQIARGKQVTIHGDGSHERNYLYVEDVAEAFDFILHRGEIGQVYNIGGNIEQSNRQVAADLLSMMRPASGWKEPEENKIAYVEDRAFNDQRYSIDSSKLNALGWQPKIGWKEGLRRTIDWYLQHALRFGNIDQALKPHPTAGIKRSIFDSDIPKPSSKQGSRLCLTDHEQRNFAARPTKDEDKGTFEYDSDGLVIRYGSIGENKDSQFCYVCACKGRQVATKCYCTNCGQAVCAKDTNQVDGQGEEYNCWTEMHHDPFSLQQQRRRRRLSSL